MHLPFNFKCIHVGCIKGGDNIRHWEIFILKVAGLGNERPAVAPASLSEESMFVINMYHAVK